MASAIPEGFHTVTPHIIVSDVRQAIDFYKKAFGAEEMCIMQTPDGSAIMHAEIQIGNSRVMMAQENPAWQCKGPKTLGGTPCTVHLYVNDAEKVFNQAVQAGGTPAMPVSDTFWGDRYGKIEDPFGHHWSIATHVKDMTPEEMAKAAEAFFANMPCE